MFNPHANNPINNGGISPSNKSSYVKELLNQKMLSLRGEHGMLSSQLQELNTNKDSVRSNDSENKAPINKLALETKLTLVQEKINQINKLISADNDNGTNRSANNFWGDRLG